jgi:hypothetical protein
MPTQPEDPGEGRAVVAVVLASSPESVEEVATRLAEAGFAVGPASGPTFAVEAAVVTYEATFGVAPVPADDGGWTTEEGDELPLGQLPEDLRQQLVAVAFERPAELHGPGPA